MRNKSGACPRGAHAIASAEREQHRATLRYARTAMRHQSGAGCRVARAKQARNDSPPTRSATLRALPCGAPWSLPSACAPVRAHPCGLPWSLRAHPCGVPWSLPSACAPVRAHPCGSPSVAAAAKAATDRGVGAADGGGGGIRNHYRTPSPPLPSPLSSPLLPPFRPSYPLFAPPTPFSAPLRPFSTLCGTMRPSRPLFAPNRPFRPSCPLLIDYPHPKCMVLPPSPPPAEGEGGLGGAGCGGSP